MYFNHFNLTLNECKKCHDHSPITFTSKRKVGKCDPISCGVNEWQDTFKYISNESDLNKKENILSDDKSCEYYNTYIASIYDITALTFY